jgi:hypothetical protein
MTSALTLKPHDIGWACKGQNIGGGLARGVEADGANVQKLCASEAAIEYPIARKCKSNFVRDRASFGAGVVSLEDALLDLADVIVSHGPVQGVFAGLGDCQEQISASLPLHEFMEQRQRAGVNRPNLLGHALPTARVRYWFLCEPSETTVTISPFNVKFPPGDSPGKGSEILERAG